MSHASGSGKTSGSDGLTAAQSEAIWKWRWLGWRDSTPAFKACLFLLVAVAFALVAYYFTVISA